MQKAMVDWGYECYVFSCPKDVAENLEQIQRDFDSWRGDPCGGANTIGADFNMEDFIWWINNYLLKGYKGEKASVLEQCLISTPAYIKLLDEGVPRIYM
jgi:hypothetical protein